MSHDELISLAVRWLKRPYKNAVPYGHSACSLVLTELSTIAGEIPDAIGFTSHRTIVIEAKTSMADYNADQKKVWRQHGFLGMGCLRYYICEDGLIPADKLPDKWGLLYVSGKRIIVVRESEIFAERAWQNEIIMLLSYIRRNSR